MNKIKTILTLGLVIGTSACSWIENYDRNEKYLEAEATPRVVIPEGLDEPDFVEVMQIPGVIDSRGLAGRKANLELPDALSTTFGVEQIVLKKLGDSRWIFLDSTPAVIWPKLLQFLSDNNVELQYADPRRGVAESIWITSKAGTAEEVYSSIVSGAGWADSDATVKNKFRLSIEPGIRSGSCEVYLEHKQVPLSQSVGPDSVKWTGMSDDLDVENEMLTKLAYYLGKTINDPVISVMAFENRGLKAELVPDRIKPVLRYKLDFDRAWATVGDALDNAQLEIADLDRSLQNYYVYYDETQQGKPGFLSRFFTREENEQQAEANRYLVHLDSSTDVIQVTVLKDESTPADALIAERLLKIIKESST